MGSVGGGVCRPSVVHCREIVTADPPGLTTLRVEIFPRRNKPGPLWPMDDEVQYRPREA